jgi:hypothetical protein
MRGRLSFAWRSRTTPDGSKGSTLRPSAVAEAPLRSELYNADQLERHGRTLAEIHRLARGRTDLL